MSRLDVSLGSYQSIDTTDTTNNPANEKSFLQGSPPTGGWYTLNRGDVQATANTGTNTITPTVGQINYVIPPAGSKISFTGPVGASGLIEFTQAYFVINPTATNFQISLTSGGAPVVIAANQVTSFSVGLAPIGFAGATHTLYFQPQRSGERWMVERVTVQTVYTTKTGQVTTSGNVLVPTVSIYYGVISPSGLIDQTQNGISDTDDLSSPLDLRSGTPLIVQFQNVTLAGFPASTRCWAWLGGSTNR